MIFHDIYHEDKFNIHGEYAFYRHKNRTPEKVSIFSNVSETGGRYPWRADDCSFTANGFYWADVLFDIMQRDIVTIKSLLCGKISRIIPL
jgi:hypothetical protein